MYKKHVIILMLAVCLKPQVTKAQMADSIKNYIDSAIGILQQNSLYASRVNWLAMKEAVHQKAAGARTKAEIFGALTLAFTALGDKHAAYYHYDDMFRLPDTLLDNRYGDSIKAAWKRGPGLFEQMIGDFAYINVPFMGVTKQEDIDRNANWLYEAVSKLAANSPKGWIIDLRRNAGGNIRPMMAGLAMFFDDAVLGYCIDRAGRATDETAVKDGHFMIDGKVQAAISNKIAALAHSKVAVLIGPGTASSGEGVAAIFKQRQHAMLLGEVTAGRGNATEGFVFNNDQSYFLISTASLGDKNKKALPEFVTPHVVVKANNAFSNPGADNVVKAAVDWLKKMGEASDIKH